MLLIVQVDGHCSASAEEYSGRKGFWYRPFGQGAKRLSGINVIVYRYFYTPDRVCWKECFLKTGEKRIKRTRGPNQQH